MSYEALDRTNEPLTDEFEKLEFLPEQPAGEAPEPDPSGEIDFEPAAEADEPPVSFSPAADDDHALSFDAQALPELGEALPYELLGTSLFDSDLDDELGLDELDELEF